MPVVNRQNNTSSPAKRAGPTGGSVLDRIRDLEESKVGHMKVSLYGMPKSGKTRLACTFPKPLLIIGAENGTASVVGTKGVKFVKLEQPEEMLQLIDGPIKEGRFSSVVVDTATKLRDMMLLKILGVDEMPTKKPWGGNALQTIWGPLATEVKNALGKLLDLPNRMPLNVVVIAQEQVFKGGEDEETSSSSDVIKPAIGSALGKSVAIWLNAECDYVCQTFIREQTAEKPIKLAGKEQTTMVKTGKKEFCLRIGPHEVYTTGFRMPLGRPEPPEAIVDPSYDKILKLIQGAK